MPEIFDLELVTLLVFLLIISSMGTNEKFTKIISQIRDEYLSSEQNSPWIVGFSGGKDSILVTHAVFEGLLINFNLLN